MANTSSLLPGTLTADVEDGRLYVHALDIGSTARVTLERSERHIADLFSLDLADEAGAPDPGRAP
jgi:multisubunit Na+/H+ antiporter MnhE subunit